MWLGWYIKATTWTTEWLFGKREIATVAFFWMKVFVFLPIISRRTAGVLCVEQLALVPGTHSLARPAAQRQGPPIRHLVHPCHGPPPAPPPPAAPYSLLPQWTRSETPPGSPLALTEQYIKEQHSRLVKSYGVVFVPQSKDCCKMWFYILFISLAIWGNFWLRLFWLLLWLFAASMLGKHWENSEQARKYSTQFWFSI